MKPTFSQMEEFYRQVADDRATKENFQAYLESPNGRVVVVDEVQSYFAPLADKEAIQLLSSVKPEEMPDGHPYRTAPNGNQNSQAELLIANWRKLAKWLDWNGAIAHKVKAGFTLKQHAPKLGSCYKNWDYLQNWSLENDEPTRDCIIFWIPRLVLKSASKTKDQQLQLLSEIRARFELPNHHLSSFGSAALNAGLILTHHNHSNERVPLNRYWIRTDSRYSDGNRLGLGDFDEDGLFCDRWDWDDDPLSDLGVFSLGVEVLGH